MSELASPNSLSIDVVYLPKDLTPEHLAEKTVVVFDVLRATTSITAALAAGVSEIRVFGDVTSAAQAARAFPGPGLLCGEVGALRPPDFDLGNSPAQFKRDLHTGRTVFLSTTNGTKAIIAARTAPVILTGAVVNAAAIASRAQQIGRDVTLLCSGTQGFISLEDVLGAGAVIDALVSLGAGIPTTDTAEIAHRLFRSSKSSLLETMTASRGSHNLGRVSLTGDIAFCAALDSIPLVGIVRNDPLRVVLFE